MAGDWIPIRINLSTDPRTVAIAGRVRKPVLHTVGALSVVWGAANEHTVDGRLMGYTLDAIDSMVGIRGFAAAMESVGWMTHDDVSVTVPDFERYNSDGAKARLKHSRRVAASRDHHRSRTESAHEAHATGTKTATTEQNRTEEKNSSSSSAASAVTAAADSTQRGGSQKHPILAALHDRGIGEPTATDLLNEGVSGADIAAVERVSDAGDGPGLWVVRLREAIGQRSSTAKAREARQAARATFDSLGPEDQAAKLLDFRVWAGNNGLECRHMGNPLVAKWGKFVDWLVETGGAA